MENRKTDFYSKLIAAEEKKASNTSSLLYRNECEQIMNRLDELKRVNIKKTLKDYRLLRKYEILEVTVEGITVKKLQKKGTNLRFVCAEDVFDVIDAIHRARGHGGRTIVFRETSEKYANVSRSQIELYLQFCEECHLKKSTVRKSVTVKPIVSNSMNSRAQVDLIDMQSQPDGKHRFILNYQDHLTKMVCLRALQTKTAEEVAFHLVDIFCDKGAPHILQSDNGREFSNKLVKEVLMMWPECKMVHGKPRHSQSQGSVERANRDIEAILACWMKDNNSTQWSQGLRFVQWKKNTRFHSGIGRTPYEAMYGQKARLGVDANSVPEEVLDDMQTEEQLAEALGVVNEVTDTEEEETGVEKQEEASAVINCISCGKRYFGLNVCNVCENPCHSNTPCSMRNNDADESVLCSICSRSQSIHTEQMKSNIEQQKQAQKKIDNSVKRFQPAKVGETVMVPVPLVDRGRAEFPNVKAVVFQALDNGTYKLGTKHGLLKQAYTRNQFTPCLEKFLSLDDVVQEREVSLREVAIAESMGQGQGFAKCSCTKSCMTRRCKCLKNSVLCNSRCKCSASCSNKVDTQ
ncbi:KRAB-A domain-containing protein 2-like [Scylla paramamosain]|uniref:KRAB-A domain-containing protein 2-like n=1 Tax=Scylla paramamosain TaxID=85552 RepID=UPI0030834383